MLQDEPGRSVLEIVLKEGRNRQIRKMCEQAGLEVARLKRTAIGPIRLGMLQPGEYRPLTAQEVKALKAFSAAVARKAQPATKSSQRDQPAGRKAYSAGKASRKY